jgi:hypothetical protein
MNQIRQLTWSSWLSKTKTTESIELRVEVDGTALPSSTRLGRSGISRGQLLHVGPGDIDDSLGQQHGDLEAWRRGLRKPIKYSDYLVFTISVNVAGSLLDIIDEDEGALFHLHGMSVEKTLKTNDRTKSSSGKTLATRTGASVIGRCRKSDLATFAITERAAEDCCFARNHLAANFDEKGRGHGAVLGSRMKTANLAYMIPSGRGGVRSKKATRDPDLQNYRWALFGVSNGEDPLDDQANATGRPEGAQVRMIGNPVPRGGNGGIFNRIKRPRRRTLALSTKLARQVEDTIETNYGVAMPSYLEKLVLERRKRGRRLARRIRRIVDKFVDRVGADTDPWERRFAVKFGIVFAAAILLSEFGIGPWTKKRAYAAIKTVYKKARAACASVNEATDALIRRLGRLMRAGRRFPTVEKGKSLSKDRASQAWGAIRTMPQVGRMLLVPYNRIERLVKPSAITGQVLRELEHRGVLVKASDAKLTRETMIKGLAGTGRWRYVCLIRKALVRHA